MKKRAARSQTEVQDELIAKLEDQIADLKKYVAYLTQQIDIQTELIATYKELTKELKTYSSPFLEKQLADQQLILQQVATVANDQTAKRKKAEQQAAQQAAAIENLQKKIQAAKDAEREAKFGSKQK